jgi:aminopeptidase N
VPDPASRAFLLAHAADEKQPLLRAVMVSGLLESVREAECDPAAFARLLLDLLAREADADTHAWLLELLATCAGRWLPEPRAAPLRARACELLLAQLRAGARGRELQSFRFLARHGRDKDSLSLCRAVARFEELPPGLQPGKQDRFLAAAALLASGEGGDEIAALQQRLAKEDVGKEVYLARAAAPTAAAKAEYFRSYRQPDAPPEQWSQDSLPFFHWPGQAALTLPWLRPALEMAPWVKQNRRIFYMPAWLDGFVNGHDDAEALAIVDDVLANGKLDDDVQRKLLQSRDALWRSVRIRAAFAAADAR